MMMMKKKTKTKKKNLHKEMMCTATRLGGGC